MKSISDNVNNLKKTINELNSIILLILKESSKGNYTLRTIIKDTKVEGMLKVLGYSVKVINKLKDESIEFMIKWD